MLHEDYVSFEQAKVLKKLGFDWPVYQYYLINGLGDVVLWFPEGERNPNSNGDDDFSAPTLYQAAKWLREEKGIVILIDYQHFDVKESFYAYHISYTYNNDLYSVGVDYPTYEKALSAGIDRALWEIMEGRRRME